MWGVRQKRKRWKFIGLFMSFFCVVLLAGCHFDQLNKENMEEITQKEELLLWSYYETDAQKEGLDKVTKSFNENQDRYEIKWEHVPTTEFVRMISRAYTEQELPDLVIIDNPDMQRFIQLGMFEDITEYADKLDLEKNYFPTAVGTIKYEDKYYGVPFNSNNVCLIYRPDLLKKAKIMPPSTWEEFDRAAHVLSKDGNYGFLMSAIDAEQGAFQLGNWILSATDKKGIITEEAVERTYELLSGLVFDGCMPADCINYSQTDVARRFIDGDIAMMENGPWIYSMLDAAGVEYEMVPMPANKRNSVVLGGENLGIIKGKNTEGAIEFIKYCAEKGGIEDFCEIADLLPSRIESAKNLISKKPELEIVMAQMDSAVARTDIDGWSNISNSLTEGFLKVITGEMTCEEAARLIY